MKAWITMRIFECHDSVFAQERIMSSWANLRIQTGKKQEISTPYFFSNSSSDGADATLSFLYAYIYTQRNAEPFYVYDSSGSFQPYYLDNPTIHYLKETPTKGVQLESNPTVASLVNSLSLTTLRRTANSFLQYNAETDARVKQFLINLGVQKQSYDAGIVLDSSVSLTVLLPVLLAFQKRTNKKTLKLFVATDDISLLQEFARKGDPSWSFVSLLRQNQSTDQTYLFLKTLAEFSLLRSIQTVAVGFGTSLGKLIYLTNPESQILSLDGKSWKAAE